MAQMYNKWDKIMELFFEFPNQSFTVREISKKADIPSSSVQRYLERLKKEGFITQENMANVTSYFKFKKSFFIIDKIYETGLVDFLIQELNPSVIIVFGSARKGEYENGSDIDLFVESSISKELDLKKFEKKLGHKIQLFVEQNLEDLQPNLFNNIINGIKLYGSFKIK